VNLLEQTHVIRRKKKKDSLVTKNAFHFSSTETETIMWKFSSGRVYCFPREDVFFLVQNESISYSVVRV